MKNLLFLAIVLLLATFGCENDNQNYPNSKNDEIPIEYTIKVISTDGGFYGYYFCDDGPVTEFMGNMDNSTSIAVYESKICQDPKSDIVLYARTENETASSLSVYMFKDQMLVNENWGAKEFSDSGESLVSYSHYLIWDEETGETY